MLETEHINGTATHYSHIPNAFFIYIIKKFRIFFYQYYFQSIVQQNICLAHEHLEEAVNSQYREQSKGWTVRGSNSDMGKMLIAFPKCSDRIWGSNEPLFSGYSGPFPGVKRLRLDVDHSPPASVEIRMRGTMSLLPLHVLVVSTRINLPFAESQNK